MIEINDQIVFSPVEKSGGKKKEWSFAGEKAFGKGVTNRLRGVLSQFEDARSFHDQVVQDLHDDGIENPTLSQVTSRIEMIQGKVNFNTWRRKDAGESTRLADVCSSAYAIAKGLDIEKMRKDADENPIRLGGLKSQSRADRTRRPEKGWTDGYSQRD